MEFVQERGLNKYYTLVIIHGGQRHKWRISSLNTEYRKLSLVGGATSITTPADCPAWPGLYPVPTWKMECISEGDMVLVQKEKSCRTFVLKKGR